MYKYKCSKCDAKVERQIKTHNPICETCTLDRKRRYANGVRDEIEPTPVTRTNYQAILKKVVFWERLFNENNLPTGYTIGMYKEELREMTSIIKQYLEENPSKIYK